MSTTLNLATTPILSQSYAVGQGYDVFGQLSLDSLIPAAVRLQPGGHAGLHLPGQGVSGSRLHRAG